MRWWYSVVRFVPDLWRGEFLNMAIIAGNDETLEWRLHVADNELLARQIDPDRTLPVFLSGLDSLARRFDEHEQLVEVSAEAPPITLEWLKRCVSQQRNTLQLTFPTPMIADGVDEAIEQLVRLFLREPVAPAARAATKDALLTRLRVALKDVGLQPGDHVAERVRVNGQHHGQLMDAVFANGSAIQMASAWPLLVTNQSQQIERVKSWGWNINDIRTSGGQLTMPTGRTVSVTSDTEIVVFGSIPRDEAKQHAEEALAVFDQVGAQYVWDAGLLAAQARQSLIDHGVALAAAA